MKSCHVTLTDAEYGWLMYSRLKMFAIFIYDGGKKKYFSLIYIMNEYHLVPTEPDLILKILA